MIKNDFLRFFAFGFAAGALVIGATVAQAHAPAPVAVHAVIAR